MVCENQELWLQITSVKSLRCLSANQTYYQDMQIHSIRYKANTLSSL